MTRMELDEFVAHHGTTTVTELPFDSAIENEIRKDSYNGQIVTFKDVKKISPCGRENAKNVHFEQFEAF